MKNLCLNQNFQDIFKELRNKLLKPNSSIVEVKSKVEDKQIIISVIDTGLVQASMIRSEYLNAFFELKEKNKKNFPGFGIGLFIASEIVHRHNGKIEVKSEPGRGSVFYFSIPVNNI